MEKIISDRAPSSKYFDCISCMSELAYSTKEGNFTVVVSSLEITTAKS